MNKRRVRLWQKNSKCHWCGIQTLLVTPLKDQFKLDLMATVEHLSGRLDGFERLLNHTDQNLTIACHKCNTSRHQEKAAQFNKFAGDGIKADEFMMGCVIGHLGYHKSLYSK